MSKKLLIGLGNPGEKYIGTRHNLGADFLNNHDVGDAEVLIPDTGMNVSGTVVKDYLRNRNIDLDNILIIHDDLELPLGEVTMTEGGSAKGHNGVRSIYEHLGTQDIPRLRMGIGRPPENVPVDKFVLSKFKPEEKVEVANMFTQASLLVDGFT